MLSTAKEFCQYLNYTHIFMRTLKNIVVLKTKRMSLNIINCHNYGTNFSIPSNSSYKTTVTALKTINYGNNQIYPSKPFTLLSTPKQVESSRPRRRIKLNPTHPLLSPRQGHPKQTSLRSLHQRVPRTRVKPSPITPRLQRTLFDVARAHPIAPPRCLLLRNV